MSFQYKKTMSITRDEFIRLVVLDTELSKKDLRVIIHLMTHLDSLNPKSISLKQISDDLGLTKKEVNKSIEMLILREIIEVRTTGSVKNGYVLLF